MKKFIVFFLVISLFVLSGDLIAQKRKKGEFSLAGGVFLGEDLGSAFGAASLGYHSKFIGTEVNAGIIFGGEAVVFGGNLVVGLFDKKDLIPYATGGLWTTTYGGFGFDVGGGVKIKLSERFAIRAEYRRYFIGDDDLGLNVILGGISVFF